MYQIRTSLDSKPDRSLNLINKKDREDSLENPNPLFRELGNQATIQNRPDNMLVQTKLRVGSANDKYEQEADHVADQVMGLSQVQSIDSSQETTPPVHRKCLECEDDDLLQRKHTTTQNVEDESILPSLPSILNNGGESLSPGTRDFFEPRFGYDFSQVRIHTDRKAQQSARAMNARAYTLGKDVVFDKGQYSPQTFAGRQLLAHELTHTIQQNGGQKAKQSRSKHLPSSANQQAMAQSDGLKTSGHQKIMLAPRQVSRATYRIGRATINVHYSSLSRVTNADLIAVIESRFRSYSGAANASAIHAPLAALSIPQRKWVLYALDLHQDNTRSPDHDRLNRVNAVTRLVAHAPNAAHSFPGTPLSLAANEALRASGWFEVGLTWALNRANSHARNRIRGILNPPPAGGVGAALDIPAFHLRMDAAVRHFLSVSDPAKFGSVGTRDLPKLQTIGNTIMEEAKSFFSPFAHTARTSVFGLNPAFHISNNIFSVTTRAPAAGLPQSLLSNRTTMVGRNTKKSPRFSDTNIFRQVNFDSNRTADRNEFATLITDLLSDPAISALMNRLVQHTGRQEGAGAATEIGLSTEFDSSRLNECQARWRVIDTLCHEVLHALAHPNIQAAASRADFGQILIEGFTEVLGTQLFNRRVKPKAGRDPVFKSALEAGLGSAPCPAPPKATVGYGAAGAGAKSIRSLATVGNKKFEVAYFLGRTDLLGL